jgi:hypothetical protein
MSEQQANQLASAIGGEAWQSGGDIWIVVKHSHHGRVITLSDDVICEYPTAADFERNAEPAAAISL